MAKQAKKVIAAPENKTIGLAMEQKAATLAQRLNEPLMSEIDTINKAKQEYEGGSFAVMFRLAAILTPEEQAALPDPKSDTGNNPAKYLVPVRQISSKGTKEVWKERYYYKELTLNLPGVVAKTKMKDQLERLNRAMKDDSVNTADIPQSFKDWAIDFRNAQIQKLTNEVNVAVRSVVAAFELFFQLRRFNTELAHVSASPIFAIGPDSKPMDGQEGRPFKVESTTTPIVIRSTVPGREFVDVKMVSVGSFLKYDVKKAKETNGGTYESVMATVSREKPEEQSGHVSGTGNAQDQSRPQSVNTADTAIARICDVHEFFDRIAREKTKAEWEQLEKELHGAGSDEAFLAAREVCIYLNRLVGSPRDDLRYKELTSAAASDAA